MEALPIFVKLTGKAVIIIGDSPAIEAKRRLVERCGARVVDDETAAALAFVEDGAEAPAIMARLRAGGLLVNVPDRPDLSDFLMPSIVDRDPVIVAIGTGGASAGLAAALRQRMEALLPASLGGLARALYAARPMLRERFPGTDGRRRALMALLAPGGPLDPMNPPPDAVAALDRITDGTVHRCETLPITSADPDALTLRAARLLGLADRMYHPADLPLVILDRARADAERILGAPPAVLPAGLSIELVWKPE